MKKMKKILSGAFRVSLREFRDTLKTHIRKVDFRVSLKEFRDALKSPQRKIIT